MSMTRREFLAATNAAVLLLILESCTPGGGGNGGGPAVPAGATPYEQALRLLLEAVRSSPDHLALRAQDAVATKNAAAIVEFVRTRLAVAPPFEPEDARLARRWGTAATLRGGQGTLRERADILADLLTRAGFKATVQEADRPSSVTAAKMYGPRTTGFAPEQSHVDLAQQVIRKAGLAVPSPAKTPAPIADPSAQILGLLPASIQKARVRDDLLPARVPVVAFEDHGKTRYAFAIGDEPVVDSAPSGLRPTIDHDAIRSVAITVSAVSSPALGSSSPAGRLVDLVSGSWPLDQVVGTQVLLTFPPIQGPKAVLQSNLGALPVRVPTLRVQAGGTQPGSQSLAAGGAPITMQGDVLATSVPGAPDGSLGGPYGTLSPLTDSERQRLTSTVRSVHVKANPAAFPEIELEVAANDASGAPVNGLDAASFGIAEDGKDLGGFLLLSNAAAQARPRVLLVYDGTYAGMWPSARAKAAFDSGIVKSLTQLASATPFDVQVVGLGAQPQPGAWAAPSAAAMTSAIAAAGESADDPWRTVGGAALDQGVTAIVLVSDFDSIDADRRRTPTFQRRVVTARVPVLAVPVGQVNKDALGQVLAMSGGTQFAAGDAGAPAQIAARLATLLSAWTGGGYRFRYRAPADGSSQRNVTVTVTGQSSKTGSAGYSVPSSPVPPPSFSGLFVKIEIGGVVHVFRRVAGVEATETGQVFGVLDDPDAIAQVRAAMDGVTTIAMEPGATTAAALIDDAIMAQLSVEPVRKLKSARPDDLLKAVGAGVARVPLPLTAMLLPGPAQPDAVRSLRIAIVQERAFEGKTVETHADFAVGGNPVTAIGSDPQAAFRAALSASVAQSVAEAGIFDDSALTRLSGRSLQAIVNGDYPATNAFLNSVPAARRDAWDAILRLYGDYHVIVPAAGSAEALWVVDPASGVTKAVLLDSTGGAILRCEGDTGELTMATTLALLAIACSLVDKIYPFWCIGINVSASGMCVVQLFDGSADFTTLPSLWLTWKPLTDYAPGNASVGLLLLVLSLAVANCI